MATRARKTKRPPDITFLDVTRKVREGRPLTQDDINRIASARLREIASTLLKADRADFMAVWESLEIDQPELREWRNLVTMPAAPDDELQEETDTRFTIGRTGKRVIVRQTEDDIDQLPDLEYLIEKILQKGTVSMIYGPGGTGKTFNALHISYCIAHGLDWFGYAVKQGLVWYINTEGGRGLKPRTRAWRKEHNRGKTSNIEFITWPVHLKDHRQELLDTLADAERKPDLLVVDNYSMCATGTNQNDQMEVTQTLGALHEIARLYGCHCLVVHHSNWTGKVNGSAAFKNHVDTMIDLSRADKDSPIVLHCEKQRDDENFSDIRLDLKIVAVSADPITLKTITSCVVTLSDAPIKPGLSDKQQLALDLLTSGDTLGDWFKKVKGPVSITEKTLDRYAKTYITKGLLRKDETPGKFPTYHRISDPENSEGDTDA
jgi:KaiC/GvpD/RAD55 family RecA-like ATPase